MGRTLLSFITYLPGFYLMNVCATTIRGWLSFQSHGSLYSMHTLLSCLLACLIGSTAGSFLMCRCSFTVRCGPSLSQLHNTSNTH